MSRKNLHWLDFVSDEVVFSIWDFKNYEVKMEKFFKVGLYVLAHVLNVNCMNAMYIIIFE